ncbi:hypothetical protein [Paractinoplanes maris]|uniref:hypothetical protein n=1 Tax=Paractinoplanes maris TaxID=1734446 RepID=UPI002020B8AF|nr:hypothetical protein [Actinoplanes maris]
MTGLGVFAAVSVGAAPAMATTGGSQSPAGAAKPAGTVKPAAPSRSRVVDVYRSRISCEFAGRLGERRGDWDDYDCDRTRGGYVLRVSFDTWGHWDSWDGPNWRGPWGIHGNRGFRDNDFFRGHRGGRDHGGRDHRDWRPRGNRVGAIPARPGTTIPLPGTQSPS